MKSITIARTHEVDVWHAKADREEGDPAGWRAIVRDVGGGDMWFGPYDTRAEAEAAVRRWATKQGT